MDDNDIDFKRRVQNLLYIIITEKNSDCTQPPFAVIEEVTLSLTLLQEYSFSGNKNGLSNSRDKEGRNTV